MSSDAESNSRCDWLRIALDAIDDAIVKTDAEGNITFMNPAAERLAEAGMDAALGRPLEDVLALLDAETRRPLAFPHTGPEGSHGEIQNVLLADAFGEGRHLEVT